MKVYGYQYESEDLLELQEVTILGDIKEIDKLIRFLQHVKEEHSKVVDETDTCHSHFRDWDTEWEAGTADIIVISMATNNPCIRIIRHT